MDEFAARNRNRTEHPERALVGYLKPARWASSLLVRKAAHPFIPELNPEVIDFRAVRCIGWGPFAWRSACQAYGGDLLRFSGSDTRRKWVHWVETRSLLSGYKPNSSDVIELAADRS